MSNITSADVGNAVKAVAAVAEAIRELGQVPSGHLYAQLCGTLTIGTYESILGILKRAELVSEQGSMLRWVGPVIP